MRKFLLILLTALVLILASWLLVQGAHLIWPEEAWMAEAKKILGWSTEALYVTTVVVTVFRVVVENGRPSRSLAWVLALILLPVLGMLAYLLVGGNLRKEKLFSLKATKDMERINRWFEGHLSRVHHISLQEKQALNTKLPLANLLTKNSKALLTEDNQLKILQNGNMTFSAMLRAMEEAKDHIHLEFYIVEEGELTDQMLALFARKRQEGVAVRWIYDGIGSWGLSRKFFRRLDDLGVAHYPFMPVRFPLLANRINFRNHRKILVIDGHTGFVGGLNLSDRYAGGLPGVETWRDTHLMLEGDAVKGLQSVFLTDWFFVSGEDCWLPTMFPHSEHQPTPLPVQIVASGPDSDHASILQGYVTAMHLARSYLYIANAYFIPNESILTALKTSAMSGVDVRILIPARSDSSVAHWSMQSYLEELLESGVKIYLYNRGFLHAKVLVSDDLLSSIGTANFDPRSFDQNFEINAFIYDEGTAKRLREDFLKDFEESIPLSLEIVRGVPSWKKMLASLARLLSPLL